VTGAARPVAVNGAPLWPPVTGVQRVSRGLARRLLAEAEPGQLRLFGAPPEFGGKQGWPPGGRAGRAAWEQVALPVEARGADVLLNLGNLAPIAFPRNLVITYDLHALRRPGDYRSWAGRSYWALAAAAYRRARFRGAISRTIADELERHFGPPVDVVVYPGVDAAFRPAPADRVEAIRRRLRLDGPYVTVVGWAQPAKRADLALEAHRRVVGDVPHQLVVVGGSRADFPDVELGAVPPTVVMTGRLSDDDVAVLHTGSAGLVFPSEYEGFGLPPIEALGSGSPVASARIPVLDEVLGGLPGVRFVERHDPADWAAELAGLLGAGDPDAARHERSRAVLERYPWEGKGRLLLDTVGAA
jgi:glycosyltransferase involved in cell wall biosynthesis